MKNLYNSEKEDSGFTLISYRSLYLLKKKFEKYNSEINKLYTVYFFKDKNNYNNIRHKIIKITSFKQLLEEVLNLTNISILKITSLNELFISNLIPENERQEKVNKTIDEINNFILDKIQKYNEIYYNKNLKREIQLNLIEDTLNNYTDYCTIIEYNKKGKIINSFEENKKLNKENEGISKSNEIAIQEEYELILKEENILYIETIPIIIADFIHLNPQYIIISNENDDIDLNKEIKVLFDEEILKRIERNNEEDEINNNKNGNFKKDKFKKNIVDESDNNDIENKKEEKKERNDRYLKSVRMIAKRNNLTFMEKENKEEEKKEEENDLKIKKKNAFNPLNKEGKTKLGIPSNIKNLKENNFEHFIPPKKRKKEITDYQRYINSKNKRQKKNTLINAGSSIIDSSNNSNNEKHITFLNSYRQKNNKNLESSEKNKINQKTQILTPEIEKLVKKYLN